MSLFRAFATISSLTLVSRMLGFVRDMLMAATMGAGPITDAFFVAFKLPNFMRRLFAEGAFNAAFVPLFSRTLARAGMEEAKRFAAESLSMLFAVLLLFSIAMIAAMPWVIPLLAPGYLDDPVRYQLTVELARITFPYLLCISLVALLTGVLNSLQRYGAGAAAPILLNLCFIASLLWLVPYVATPAHAAAWGVFSAGIAQLLWLWFWAARAGYRLLPRIPKLTPDVKKLLLLMAPVAFGAGVAQVNLLIDVVIASYIDEAVSYLYYADRLNELPLGVIGVAIGSAMLPMLSAHWQKGEEARAQHLQNRGLELAMLFSLPAAFALAAIALPITSVLFYRGAFTAHDADMVAWAVMAYAVGLPSFVAVKVFAPGFFANEDTKTPVKIAIACMLVNIIFNLLLMQVMGHVGLALATSIAGWVNAIAMGVILYRRKIFVPDARVIHAMWKLACAAIGMTLVLVGLNIVLETSLDMQRPLWERVSGLALLVGVGSGTYFAIAMLLRAVHISEIRHYLRGRTK